MSVWQEVVDRLPPTAAPLYGTTWLIKWKHSFWKICGGFPCGRAAQRRAKDQAAGAAAANPGIVGGPTRGDGVARRTANEALAHRHIRGFRPRGKQRNCAASRMSLVLKRGRSCLDNTSIGSETLRLTPFKSSTGLSVIMMAAAIGDRQEWRKQRN